MSSSFRVASRIPSRTWHTQPSSAVRSAMRQSRRFLSAARPEPQAEQSWRWPAWAAEKLLFGTGIGVGWALSERYLGNNMTVKAEAIDLDEGEDNSAPANLKAKKPKPKAKSKVPENEKPNSEASSSTDEVPSSESDAEVAASEGDSAGAAYNPETGEINWDCPCLGGMAHGPCGEEFRAAFSCFVYSEAEPKGIECVEKFKGMQDCFRAHPEIYGEEIMADDEEDDPPSGTDSPALETSEFSSLSDAAGPPTPAHVPVPSESAPSTSLPDS